MRITTYKIIQERIVSDRVLHEKILENEKQRRNKDMQILDEKENLVNRIHNNPAILYTGYNMKKARELDEDIEKSLNDSYTLLYEDDRLDIILSKYKFPLEMIKAN